MTKRRQILSVCLRLAACASLGINLLHAMDDGEENKRQIILKTENSKEELDQETVTYHFGYKPASQDIFEAFDAQQKTSKFLTRHGRFSSMKKCFHDTGGTIELSQTRNEKEDTGWARENVYDQGGLGSCIANAAAFSIRQQAIHNSENPLLTRNNPEDIFPSRIYHYYNTRLLEGKIHKDPGNIYRDQGGSIAGAIMALDLFGAASEVPFLSMAKVNFPDLQGSFRYEGCKYDPALYTKSPDGFNYLAALDWDMGQNGMTNQGMGINPYPQVVHGLHYIDLTTEYRKPYNPLAKPQDLLNSPVEKSDFIGKIRESLSRDHPFYFGTLIDKEFMKMKYQGGYFHFPNNNPESYINAFKPEGGHALSVVGHGQYNLGKGDKRNYFKIINSWGPTWGDKGFGYLPEEYLSEVNKFGVEGFEFMIDKLPHDDIVKKY